MLPSANIRQHNPKNSRPPQLRPSVAGISLETQVLLPTPSEAILAPWKVFLPRSVGETCWALLCLGDKVIKTANRVCVLAKRQEMNEQTFSGDANCLGGK